MQQLNPISEGEAAGHGANVVAIADAKEDGAIEPRHGLEMNAGKVEEGAGEAAPPPQLFIEAGDRHALVEPRHDIERATLLRTPEMLPSLLAQRREGARRIVEIMILEIGCRLAGWPEAWLGHHRERQKMAVSLRESRDLVRAVDL